MNNLIVSTLTDFSAF